MFYPKIKNFWKTFIANILQILKKVFKLEWKLKEIGFSLFKRDICNAIIYISHIFVNIFVQIAKKQSGTFHCLQYFILSSPSNNYSNIFSQADYTLFCLFCNISVQICISRYVHLNIFSHLLYH